MIKRLKYKLLYWLTSKLLPIVDEKELIAFSKNGKVFIDNRELNPAELNNLRSEADIINEMRIWEIIVNKLNEKTQEKIYKEAVDVPDLIVGKTILYVLNFQKELINKLKH